MNQPRLQELCKTATALRKENFAGSFVLEHIRREYNKEADALANVAMTIGGALGAKGVGVNVADNTRNVAGRAWQIDIARHVIGSRLTQESRLQHAIDDVARAISTRPYSRAGSAAAGTAAGRH